jgi:aryl-alcohol dehydrogenase-like predicted oxidoreductase
MQMHALGKTGLSIAPIVFGGNVFGWTVDEKTSFNILDAFFDAGFNALDTADVYSAWVPAKPAQIALAWLMQKKGVTAPIASAANLYQLESLTKSTSLKLSHEAMGLLDKAGA